TSRCALPSRSTRLCSEGLGHFARFRRFDRFLRQTAREIRAAPRNLSRVRTARHPLLFGGNADLAQGKALPQEAACRRVASALQWRSTSEAAVQRASPVA